MIDDLSAFWTGLLLRVMITYLVNLNKYKVRAVVKECQFALLEFQYAVGCLIGNPSQLFCRFRKKL